MHIRLVATALTPLVLFSCNKAPAPTTPAPVYEVFVNNEFNELNARFAVFLSDPDNGATLAFRYVPGEDSIVLQIPNSNPSDRYAAKNGPDDLNLIATHK